MIRRIGPIYDLGDGVRLQDIDAGCGSCGKRLAEVIHDPSLTWAEGAWVCIDCGTVARKEREPVAIKPSYRAPGLRVACCTLCTWTSMPTSLDKAAVAAQKHLTDRHAA